MLHATRSLIHRWYREDIGPDGIQRRRALLARDRRERRTRRHATLLTYEHKRLTVAYTSMERRNNELADKLKALLERVPVYTRVQEDERHYGRTFIIPVAFNPDVIIRTLVRGLPSRLDTLDLDRECHYLVDFASEKLLATLREAAAEHLGMPGRPR